jgi:hypothetical protein
VSRGLLALAAAPLLLTQPGTYDLTRLGAGRGLHDAPFTVGYRLPEGTRAGKPFYVGVRLHGEMPLAPSVPLANVTTTNNTFTCAWIRVNAHRYGANTVFDWDGGPPALTATGTARGPALAMRFTSVCIIPSVRGGRSTVRFAGRGLRVFADSAVVIARRLRDLAHPPGTQAGPSAAFAGVYPPEHVRAGTSVALDVRLRAFRPRVAVTLRARAPRGPVEVIDRRTRVVVRGGPIRTRTSIRLRALRPGRSWVAVSTGASEVVVMLEVDRAG